MTPLFNVSLATVAEMLMLFPCCTLYAEDEERVTLIGGELAQPTVSITGSKPRKVRAKANVLLR